MSRHDLNKVTEIVTKTAKAMYDKQNFFVGQLAAKAEKVAQAFPHDQTSVGFSNFLRKRAETALFITRAELKDVYNRLYCVNNKLVEHFTEEFGLTKKAEPTPMRRDPREGEDLLKEAYKKCADSLLSEQLTDVFDKKPYKPFSKELVKDAQKVCARELNICGLLPKRVDVVAGREDLLICMAVYDTPKGLGHVVIPVEARNNKALIPSLFLSSEGFVNLNTKFVKEHLTATAGKTYQFDAQQLLKVLSEAKDGSKKPMSDIERIVLKTAVQKETPASYLSNNIIYKEANPLDVIRYDVGLPKHPDVEKYAARLSTMPGAVEFKFGQKVVEMGRGLIEQELKLAGYRNSQISVSGMSEDSIMYSVSIDGTFGFKVPVKIANKKVQVPNIIVASGRVFEFSPSGISELLKTADTDPVAVAKASPLCALKPSALVDEVRQAMFDENYIKAEEALHVLKHAGDDVAYRAGYTAFIDELNKRTVKKEASAGCSMPIKNSTSKYMICSHTGLPLHKVYQDEFGFCRPLYRKGMKESSEGASYNICSKIFFE